MENESITPDVELLVSTRELLDQKLASALADGDESKRDALLREHQDSFLGSTDVHERNGSRILAEIRAEIEKDPILSSRLARNYEIADLAVHSLKPVHACRDASLVSIIKESSIHPFEDVDKQGIQDIGNSVAGDRWFGLTGCTFFSCNFAHANQYGSDAIVLNNDLFEDERCFVTPRDLITYLRFLPDDVDCGLEFREMTGRDIDYYFQTGVLEDLSPQAVILFNKVWEMQVGEYLKNSISGKRYLEIVGTLLAVCKEEITEENVLDPLASIGDFEGGFATIDLLPESVLERMLRRWLSPEIKVKGPVSLDKIVRITSDRVSVLDSVLRVNSEIPCSTLDLTNTKELFDNLAAI